MHDDSTNALSIVEALTDAGRNAFIKRRARLVTRAIGPVTGVRSNKALRLPLTGIVNQLDPPFAFNRLLMSGALFVSLLALLPKADAALRSFHTLMAVRIDWRAN